MSVRESLEHLQSAALQFALTGDSRTLELASESYAKAKKHARDKRDVWKAQKRLGEKWPTKAKL